NMKLFAGAQLQRGVRVDAPLDAATGPRPRPRRAIWLGAESSLVAGEYQLRLRPRQWPSHAFWLEAVAADGRVVAREWIDPSKRDTRRPARPPAAVEHPVEAPE